MGGKSASEKKRVARTSVVWRRAPLEVLSEEERTEFIAALIRSAQQTHRELEPMALAPFDNEFVRQVAELPEDLLADLMSRLKELATTAIRDELPASDRHWIAYGLTVVAGKLTGEEKKNALRQVLQFIGSSLVLDQGPKTKDSAGDDRSPRSIGHFLAFDAKDRHDEPVRRVVGGPETPTIEEVNDGRNKKIKAIVEGLDLSDEQRALAEMNFDSAWRATEEGISVAELAEQAGVILGGQDVLTDWERAIVQVAPVLTKKEREEIWAEALIATKPPIRKLTSKEITAIERVAEKNPWSGRPTYHYSPFKWVKEHYDRWVPGLLQHHLKMDRSSLYDAFAKRVKRDGLPEWLDVPTEGEAELRNTPDPVQRARILAVRRLGRDHSRGVRSLKRVAGPIPKI